MIHNTNTTASRLNWGTNRIPQSKRLLRSAQPQWTDDREWWSTLWEIPEIDQLMSSATIEQTRPQLSLQLLHSTRLDRLQTMKKCHPQFLPTMNLPWLSHHLQTTQVLHLLEGCFISKSYFTIDTLTFLLGGMRFSRITFNACSSSISRIFILVEIGDMTSNKFLVLKWSLECTRSQSKNSCKISWEERLLPATPFARFRCLGARRLVAREVRNNYSQWFQYMFESMIQILILPPSTHQLTTWSRFLLRRNQRRETTTLGHKEGSISRISPRKWNTTREFQTLMRVAIFRGRSQLRSQSTSRCSRECHHL